MTPTMVLVAMLGLGLGCVETIPAVAQPHADDELLVQWVPGLSESERLSAIDEMGLRELKYMPRLSVSHVNLDGESVALAMRRLGDDPRLRFAEPNYEARAIGTPNDPYFSEQWNLSRIGVQEAWRQTRGVGATVAVLDTGVEPGGTDGINDLRQGKDFVYGREMYDAYGHGTHVAGTVAQNTDNARGAAGVAPGATVIPVKVLGDDGSGWISDIAAGVEWSTDQGADVVTMSLGSWGASRTMSEAVRYAVDNGTVVIAAAGNEDTGQLNYPAAYPEVISVGASTSSDRLSSFTNWGEDLDLVAPGVDILQEVWDGRNFYYSAWSGTSMATPHVAGVAALIMSLGVDDPHVVRDILRRSAQDLGDEGHDKWFGYGVLDAEAAVAMALEHGGEVPEDSGPEEPPEDVPDEDSPADDLPDTEEPPEEGDGGPDHAEPVISDVEYHTEGGRFWFTWSTDEPATTDLWFEQWGWFLDWDMVVEHNNERSAPSGTAYTVWVSSEDESGNIAYAGPYEVVVD